MKYIKPELKVVKFDTEEILTASSAVTNATEQFKTAGINDVNNAVAVDVSALLK